MSGSHGQLVILPHPHVMNGAAQAEAPPCLTHPPAVAHPHVEGAAQQLLVVGPDVDDDGQADCGGDATCRHRPTNQLTNQPTDRPNMACRPTEHPSINQFKDKQANLKARPGRKP